MKKHIHTHRQPEGSKCIIHYSKVTLLLLAAFAITSCEKVVNFQPEEIDPHVVMLSRPEAGSKVGVDMSYSRFFLDEHQFPVIDNATLTLNANGTLFMPDSVGNGHYQFPYVVQSGDTLTLTAFVPGYDKVVTAGTRVPLEPVATIHDFVVDTPAYSDYYYYGNCHYKIRFTLQAPNSNSYYAIRILFPSIYYDNDTWSEVFDTTQLYPINFECSDALLSSSMNVIDIIDGDDGSFYGTEAIVSSELFKNGSHDFTLEFETYISPSYFGDTIQHYYLDTPLPTMLEIRSISPELYNYNRSAQSTSIIDQLLGEPMQVICNINNGIGVFGASTSKKFRCSNPRYEDFNHDDDYYYEKSATQSSPRKHKSQRK